MIEFITESLLLLPFLFVTYLVLEALEAHTGGALERFLERSSSLGPLAGALSGIIPQCGVSAVAASFYAGGVITVGTLIAVFLSTSDELLPILVATPDFPVSLLIKIAALKTAGAIIAGFCINGILRFIRHYRRSVSVSELCEHSHCSCTKRKGIVVPAIIHTLEIFVFIVVISGIIELSLHYLGEDCLMRLHLTKPFLGELAAGAIGLIPNCAVSVASAKLYLAGAMSPGALMASSFVGSGVGLLVLFRTNRNLIENLSIFIAIYICGTVLGYLTGFLL